MPEKFYLDLEFWLVFITILSGVIWLVYGLFTRGDSSDKTKKEPVVVEYARSFFPVLLLVVFLRSFVAEPFRIPSGSMMPTLEVGDFILVNKFSYGIRIPVIRKKILSFNDPKRGDVFVFRYPEEPWKNFIKRVVGLPGDTIRWQGKNLYVNGQLIPNEEAGSYVAVDQFGDHKDAKRHKENLMGAEHDIIFYHDYQNVFDRNAQVTVPEGQYFAMGDNRFGSHDSRFWGFVPEENLVGKAMIVWMHYAGKNDGVELSRIGTTIK